GGGWPGSPAPRLRTVRRHGPARRHRDVSGRARGGGQARVERGEPEGRIGLDQGDRRVSAVTMEFSLTPAQEERGKGMFDLKDRVAVVTYASRGLVRQDALTLAGLGADGVITDVLVEDDPNLQQTEEAQSSR